MNTSARHRAIGLAMLRAHASMPFRWADGLTAMPPGASRLIHPLKAPVEQGKNDE